MCCQNKEKEKDSMEESRILYMHVKETEKLNIK